MPPSERRSALSVSDLLCATDVRSQQPQPLPPPPPPPAQPQHHHLPHFVCASPSSSTAPLSSSEQLAPSTHALSTRHSSFDEVQKPSRGPWRIEEDKLLTELVKKHGARHWSAIAQHFPRRSGKQARERWMNQLNPTLKKKNWSPEEDKIILQAHAELGNKWSAIAQWLPGRTDNSVKNRFNSTLRRAMRERAQYSVNLDPQELVDSLHAKPYALQKMQAVVRNNVPQMYSAHTCVSTPTYLPSVNTNVPQDTNLAAIYQQRNVPYNFVPNTEARDYSTPQSLPALSHLHLQQPTTDKVGVAGLGLGLEMTIRESYRRMCSPTTSFHFRQSDGFLKPARDIAFKQKY